MAMYKQTTIRAMKPINPGTGGSPKKRPEVKTHPSVSAAADKEQKSAYLAPSIFWKPF